MKVKKYRALTMPEAMKLVRNELGNDAVILNSRVIHTGGFLGFFKKRSIEIIAAIDEKIPAEQMKPVIKDKQKPIDNRAQQSNSQIGKVTDKKNTGETEEWRKELSELKSLLNTVVVDKSNGNGGSPLPLPNPLQHLQQLLSRQGLNRQIIDNVLEMALEQWHASGELASENEVLQWAQQYLIEQISHLPFGGISFTKKYVNVVGPTGVGKTTTLAKIAANCILNDKKKVAFITTDTYRIAAIEQLKIYANILHVPIEVCYNLEDFKKAIIFFDSYDLIFIDTAGRNFRNAKYVGDLQNIIDFQQEMETFLVLSLTSKQIDMEEIYQQFSAMTINQFIFTKADETSTFGAMFNMIHSGQKAAAYITYGQNVPDDIVAATPENVVNHIIGVDP